MKLTRRVLHRPARAVEFRYPIQNQRLASEMQQLMLQEHGIGLAAPQIGVSRRVFVMQIGSRSWNCFNPEITESSDLWEEFDEGCLSFPGDHCIINRPQWIRARYQDHRGDWQEEKLEDLPARCFQHELDHLDGITMWDRHKEQNAKQS